MSEAPAIDCRALTVAFNGRAVLPELGLTVARGEVVALLGPSGSGKTTLLHALAGFVLPSGGEVWLAGHRVAWPGGGLPPEQRGVGVVFQNYALWPHMRALDVVAYPLRRAGHSRTEARRKAAEMLERLQISHLADRRPAQLSGGEQQRVAVARALCRHGVLNLFDEPTAHLDAPLRAVVQAEIAKAGRETGAALLYATHDASEALAVADRVAVIRDGRIIADGTPREVYEHPVDAWAAALTGPVSVVPGRLVGAASDLLVRPDWVELDGPWEACVRQVQFRGTHTDYELSTETGTVLARVAGPPRLAPGDVTRWGLHLPHALNDHAVMRRDTP